MAANKQNNASLGKMLKTLNKRSIYGMRSQSSLRKQWPTALSFSMLNKIDTIARKPQKTLKTYPSTKSFERPSTREATMNTISLVSFSRPQTCSSQGRTRMTEKPQLPCQKINLFNFVKHQKLARLQKEKQKLMSTMFNEQTEIHPLGQDEESQKPNSLNIKAYRFLNRLMDIKEQIYHTSNCRPQTSGQVLRKKRNRQPL